MELMVTLLFICGAISLGLISVGGGLVLRGRSKLTGRPMAATDYLTDPPKALDYGYIDFLERELEVGRYDPDRIALEREMLVDEGMELSAITGMRFSADLWRKELTKYEGMGVDEILRGQPYADHFTVTDQARIKVEKYGVNYRLMVIAMLMHRHQQEGRRLDARLSRIKEKFGDAFMSAAEFFGPDEAKPAREWAGRGVRTRVTQDPVDDGGHTWVDNALAELGVEARPVDDSWADERLGDAIYGPRTADAIRSYSRGGLRRTYRNDRGDRMEIRSWGN